MPLCRKCAASVPMSKVKDHVCGEAEEKKKTPETAKTPKGK